MASANCDYLDAVAPIGVVHVPPPSFFCPIGLNGNLPYYVCSLVLFNLSSFRWSLSTMITCVDGLKLIKSEVLDWKIESHYNMSIGVLDVFTESGKTVNLYRQ
jgi:hypothetical protein